MKISFYNNKEFFDGKEYPICSTFTTIYNLLSSLTYCTDCVLKSYKSIELENYKEDVHINELTKRFNDIATTIGIDTIKEQYIVSTHSPKLINDISLSYKDFSNLLFFIDLLDEFIRLVLNDKRINKYDRFIFFFNGLHKYTFPYEIIENKKIEYKYNELQNDMFINRNIYYENSNNKKTIIENHYNDIFKKDKQILKEIVKNTSYTYTYECKDFIEVLLISYMYILKKNLNFKQCNYCKRFFIAQNGNQEYCDNIRPQKMYETDIEYKKEILTCRNFNKKYPTKTKENKIKDAERKVTQRIEKRIRTGIETKEYLKEWKIKIEKYKATHFNNNDYINWLINESDAHQIRRRKNGSQRNNKK